LKKVAIFLALCFTFSLYAVEEGKPLKIRGSIMPQRLLRSQEGKVVLRISVKKGITVSPQPSFIIEFSPCEGLIFPKNFFTASDLGIEILEEKGHQYLNLKKPIEIPFTVSNIAKKGRHTLRGKIKYFAYSLKGDWCLKVSSEFSASLSVRIPTIRKKEKR
jgi:hypothetical protein